MPFNKIFFFCIRSPIPLFSVFHLDNQATIDRLCQEDEEQEVTDADLEKEFTGKIAERYKIAEHRFKACDKFYAFEHDDVPNMARYKINIVV